MSVGVGWVGKWAMSEQCDEWENHKRLRIVGNSMGIRDGPVTKEGGDGYKSNRRLRQ